jgi:hypothetical protein
VKPQRATWYWDTDGWGSDGPGTQRGTGSKNHGLLTSLKSQPSH